MKNKNTNVFWPIFLIALGTLFIINNLNLIPSNIWDSIWQFWPILVIILGATTLMKKEFFAGMMILTLGSLFQASVLFGWEVWGSLWPLFIISAGIGALLEKYFGGWSTNASKSENTEDMVNETIFFSGLEKAFTSKEFKGGKIETVFGGAEIDLSKAKLGKNDAKLKIDSVFGGVELKISDQYNVSVKSVGIFGGVEDKSEAQDKKLPTLFIEANAVFGAVEIKY